jgi:uncharacterized integral membrane protein
MFHPIKKVIFNLTFNLSLFLMLIIGIQNSANKRNVNLIITDSVKLPISFIVGISFISGSLIGSFITKNQEKIK